MRRVTFVIFLVFLTLLGAGQARAETASLADVTAWVGKYPFDAVEGRDMLAFKPFEDTLKKILGKDRYAFFLKELWDGVSFPVEQEEGVISIRFCQKHNCPVNRILIYVRPADQSMDACWQRDTEETALWLSTGSEGKSIGFAGCLDAQPFDLYKMHKAK